MFKRNNEETSIWISTTDLMSGLLVIFLFIAVLMNEEVNEANRKVDELTKASDYSKIEIKKSFENNFSKQELKKFNIGVNADNIGHASFKNDGVNFEAGSSTITPAFKQELDIFLPKYIKSLYECNHENIKEIRIEGHTSSEWFSNTSDIAEPNVAYINNMELSQSRTREIIKYALSMPELLKYHDFIKDKLTANGLSSSHLILNSDGSENKEASRRIEFRIVADDEKVVADIKKAIQKE